jgi:hypothetical protein
MKDLFLLTADADAQAVMKAVLRRHHSLEIRPITFDIDRHTSRDSGMITDGPELMGLKLNKNEYSHLLLMWDHDGSGWHDEPSTAVADVQRRLDNVTWQDRSAAVVLVPELEEWLWHNRASIARQIRSSSAELDRMVQTAYGNSLLPDLPKESFERLLYEKLKRKPLPMDFEQIAERASLVQWQRSQSFRTLVEILRRWFPRP